MNKIELDKIYNEDCLEGIQRKMNESVDIFENKVAFIKPSLSKEKEKTLFDDYENFVDKFKTKKTTDDCYTPPEVYNCVLRYVSEKCNIRGAEIVRPFYPGGDNSSSVQDTFFQRRRQQRRRQQRRQRQRRQRQRRRRQRRMML